MALPTPSKSQEPCTRALYAFSVSMGKRGRYLVPSDRMCAPPLIKSRIGSEASSIADTAALRFPTLIIEPSPPWKPCECAQSLVQPHIARRPSRGYARQQFGLLHRPSIYRPCSYI